MRVFVIFKTKESTGQSVSRSVGQSVSRSVSQSIDQSVARISMLSSRNAAVTKSVQRNVV